MSLFLSGAMVVAFAPAVAPAVAEFAGYGSEYTAFAATVDTAANIFAASKISAATAATIGADGKLSSAIDQVVTAGAQGVQTINLDVTAITTPDGQTVDVSDRDLYKVTIYSVAQGGTETEVDGSTNKISVGNYKVKIVAANYDKDSDGTPEKTTPYADGTLEADLTVTAKSLYAASPVVYEVNEVGSVWDGNVTDTDFTYTGNAIKIGIAINGKDVTQSVGIKVGKKAANGSVTYTEYAAATSIKGAGTYSVQVTGNPSTDYAGSVWAGDITVGKLDVSGLDITLAKGSGATPGIASVTSGGRTVDVKNELEVSGLVSAKNATSDRLTSYDANTLGTYTFTVSPVKGTGNTENANMTGTKTVTFDNTATTLSIDDFLYGETSLKDYIEGKDANNDGRYTDAGDVAPYAGVTSNAASLFDYKKVTAKNGSTTVENGNIKFEVEDADGKAATLDDLKKAGTWKVTATIDAKKAAYAVGGSATFEITNVNGTITNISVEQDGVVKGALDSKTYDGTDALAGISVKVYRAGDTAGSKVEVSEAGAVKVTWTEQGKSTPITSATDAGTYVLTVESGTWDVGTVTPFTLTVNKALAKNAYANKGDSETYTGQALSPELTFWSDPQTFTDGEPTVKTSKQVAVPADGYTVVWRDASNKVVTEIKDAGAYTASIVLTDAAAKNYALTTANTGTAATATFTVDAAPAYPEAKSVAYTGEVVDAASVLKFYNKAAGQGVLDRKQVEVDPAAYVTELEYSPNAETTSYSAATEIKAIGDYRLTVKASKEDVAKNYAFNRKAVGAPQNAFDKAVVTFKVTSTAVGYIEADQSLFTEKGILPYTGGAIEPTWKFWTADPATDAKAKELAVAAGAYTVSYKFSKEVDGNGELVAPVTRAEIKETGYYKPVFLDANTGDEFTFANYKTELIHVDQVSDPTTVTKLTQKISKVTPTSKAVKGLKKNKLKKTQSFKLSATGAKTKVTFAKSGKVGGAKIAVSKAGKVTVKKGLKKGTYKVKVKATAAADKTYKAASKTVTVKITVKK